LLRVLAEKEITPLGSASPIPVHLNVICATHRNIQDMVAEGSFREDLFYRLKGISFVLPPLRQRTDLAQLIQMALAIEAKTEIGAISIDKQALDMLTRYDWPGNIRQLRNVLRYALAMSDGDRITSTNLPEEVTDQELPALQQHIETSAPAKMPSVAREECSWSPMEQAERTIILDSLRKHQWRVVKAAKEIGIGRSTLYRKLEKYDIVPPNKR
jgi:transcriptional regulator of acetoin/glycerol metabolism